MTDTQDNQEELLPALPEAVFKQVGVEQGTNRKVQLAFYSGEQMRAYALQSTQSLQTTLASQREEIARLERILDGFDSANEQLLSAIGLELEDVEYLGSYVEGIKALKGQLSAQPVKVDVDWLSNVIRAADGENTLGAGALAEKIVEALPGMQVKVPEVWQLVPKEPTEAMTKAGMEFVGTLVYGAAEVRNIYLDMLSAAPVTGEGAEK